MSCWTWQMFQMKVWGRIANELKVGTCKKQVFFIDDESAQNDENSGYSNFTYLN